MDFVVGGGGASVDEGEVGVGGEGGDVEEREPQVDPVVGEAFFGGGDAGGEDGGAEEGY